MKLLPHGKAFCAATSVEAIYVTASERSYEIFSGSIDAPEISSF